MNYFSNPSIETANLMNSVNIELAFAERIVRLGLSLTIKTTLLCVFFIGVLAAALPPNCVQAQSNQAQSNQAGLEFDVHSIVPQSVTHQQNFQIQQIVTVRDHLFQFVIESPYGTFPVAGIPLLEKRLSELQAIGEATSLSKEAVGLKSALKILQQTPQGAGHILSDPLGTLNAAPRGVERLASSLINPVDRHAGTARKRKLAANLGVDSETRNPVLAHLLTELARRQFLGETATKFTLSAALPGLGTLSTVESFRAQVANRSPHELLAELDQELTQFQVWPPIRKAFLNNDRWTLLEKLTFMQFYRQIATIEHADVMLYLASGDASESQILRRLVEMRLLASLHSQTPVQSLTESGLPIAWLEDGSIVGIFSSDYLTNSQAVQNVASKFRKANPQRSIALLSTGWVSPDAQKTLDANQIKFLRPEFLARDAVRPTRQTGRRR